MNDVPEPPPSPFVPTSTPEAVTTALSLLSARVAVLERRAGRAHRRERVTLLVLIALLGWVALSLTR